MPSEERRRIPRVRAYRPVRLQVAGNPRIMETLTKDLSSAGMRCLSPVSLPVGSELSTELTAASGQEPIVLKAQAVWFRTIPYSDQFELGISFRDVGPDAMRRLSGCLKGVSSVPSRTSV